MTLDVTNIVLKNSLFGIKPGISFNEAIEILSLKYFIENDFKNDYTTIIIPEHGDYSNFNIQITFASQMFWYGLINISGEQEVFCFGKKMNENTTSESVKNILNLSNVSFTEIETSKDDELEIKFENESTFLFYHEDNTYYLQTIYWSKLEAR